MNEKGLHYIVGFILVLVIAIFATKMDWASQETATTATGKAQPVVVQLAEKTRPNAATMVLLNAPPMQPATHIDRWNPAMHEKSCLACHGKPETGAPTPTKEHFYDNDTKGTVFRDNCVQCHAQQNDTKTAFNEK